MKMALKSCGMFDYVTGATQCPDPYANPWGWKNWGINNTFTWMQIQCNMMELQLVHVSQCKTAYKMWKSLEGVYDNKGHQALVIYMWKFYGCAAEEGDDIIEHLNKMKEGCECINIMGNPWFYISDIMFKLLICQSLPSIWDNFTDTYIGSQTFNEEDPRISIGSQHFIGILKTEYNHHMGQKLKSL